MKSLAQIKNVERETSDTIEKTKAKAQKKMEEAMKIRDMAVQEAVEKVKKESEKKTKKIESDAKKEAARVIADAEKQITRVKNEGLKNFDNAVELIINEFKAS